jgi:ribose transport system permease protein
MSLLRGGVTRATSSSVIYITLALVAIIAIFAVLAPSGTFLSAFNLRNIANDGSVVLLFAVGATLVIISGGLDLSQGSVATFAGVATALSMKAMTAGGMGAWPTIACGTIVGVVGGGAWGAVNGWLISYARLNSFVVTLGSFGTALGVARLMSDGTTAYGTPAQFTDSIGLGVWFGIPAPFLISAATATAFGLMLAWTRAGEHIYLVGSNEEAARRAGIDVRRQIFKVYMLSGLLAGLAGVIDTARFAGASVSTGHITEVVAAIAGVVIGGASLVGGVGVMLGSAIGVFIPTVLNNGLVILKIERFWQEVAVGIILVAAVAFDQWRRGRPTP